MALVGLLYWEGCPSHPQALAELRAALAAVGRPEIEVALTPIETEQQARERGFVGSPTVRVAGADVAGAGEVEGARLSCRVYRRRDGRYSPTPDPLDLRDALSRLPPRPDKEATS